MDFNHIFSDDMLVMGQGTGDLVKFCVLEGPKPLIFQKSKPRDFNRKGTYYVTLHYYRIDTTGGSLSIWGDELLGGGPGSLVLF